mmetsp:Transcript_23921/g.71399  ORF Transcript_23921/g.71399 Transcript_23921/m.71399 type:complete len:333 (+) Transcript_23921:149-1147(+)
MVATGRGTAAAAQRTVLSAVLLAATAVGQDDITDPADAWTTTRITVVVVIPAVCFGLCWAVAFFKTNDHREWDKDVQQKRQEHQKQLRERKRLRLTRETERRGASHSVRPSPPPTGYPQAAPAAAPAPTRAWPTAQPIIRPSPTQPLQAVPQGSTQGPIYRARQGVPPSPQAVSPGATHRFDEDSPLHPRHFQRRRSPTSPMSRQEPLSQSSASDVVLNGAFSPRARSSPRDSGASTASRTEPSLSPLPNEVPQLYEDEDILNMSAGTHAKLRDHLERGKISQEEYDKTTAALVAPTMRKKSHRRSTSPREPRAPLGERRAPLGERGSVFET